MAITGDYNLYQPYNFGSLTYGRNIQKQPQSNGYHQASAWQGVPNTTPQIIGFPTVDDMKLAEQFAQSGVSLVANPFGVNQAQGSQAYVPTGTGELSPVLEGRKDEIEDCPWREYYA